MSSSNTDATVPADDGEGRPLYGRLPRGPHRLGRRAVARNQRARLQGAMAAALCAPGGYDAVSVAQLTTLAGVSRRSFYELFANKEDCFLAAFDAVVERWTRTLRRAGARRHDDSTRLAAALDALAALTIDAPLDAALALVHAPVASTRARSRLHMALGDCERPLCELLAAGDERPPAPLARAMLGGVHALAAGRVATPRRTALPLDTALAAWTRPFVALPAAVCVELRASPIARGQDAIPARSSADVAELDERLHAAALRLALRCADVPLTPAAIADEAGHRSDDVLTRFADAGDCYEQALERAGEAILADAHRARRGRDGPSAVRAITHAVCAHLAAQPLHSHALGHGAQLTAELRRGPRLDVARALAGLLSAHAPPPAAREAVVTGIAGALAHTVAIHGEAGCIGLLPAVADQLSFVALAPSVGADAAAAALAGPPPGVSVCAD